MAEEHPQTDEERAEDEGSAAEEAAPAAAPGGTLPPRLTTGAPESPTRGMLREAIEKVKAEIAHHENEAQKHLKLAEQLRKDLRDCFAFFRQWGKEPSAPAVESGGPPAAAPASAAAPRHHRPEGKKKRTGRRGRGG
jgi:hypothetical protein